MPDFINHDSKSPYIAVFTNDLDDLGWYLIEITAELDVINYLDDTNYVNTWLKDPVTGAKIYSKANPPPDFIYTHSYNVTIAILEIGPDEITDENTKPYMLPKPVTIHKVIVGKAWSYTMGRVFDFEGNKVTVTALLRNAANFVDFDPNSMTLSIEEGKTDI